MLLEREGALEDLLHGTRDHPRLLLSSPLLLLLTPHQGQGEPWIALWPLHRISLPRASLRIKNGREGEREGALLYLAISKNADIVAIQGTLHELGDLFEDQLLRGVRPEHTVKLKVVRLRASRSTSACGLEKRNKFEKT